MAAEFRGGLWRAPPFGGVASLDLIAEIQREPTIFAIQNTFPHTKGVKVYRAFSHCMFFFAAAVFDRLFSTDEVPNFCVPLWFGMTHDAGDRRAMLGQGPSGFSPRMPSGDQFIRTNSLLPLCRGAGPRWHQKVNENLGPTVWKAVHQNDTRHDQVWQSKFLSKNVDRTECVGIPRGTKIWHKVASPHLSD